jgi:hypothetical protein
VWCLCVNFLLGHRNELPLAVLWERARNMREKKITRLLGSGASLGICREGVVLRTKMPVRKILEFESYL